MDIQLQEQYAQRLANLITIAKELANDPNVTGVQLVNDFDEAFVLCVDYADRTQKSILVRDNDELVLAKETLMCSGWKVTVDTTQFNYRRLHLYMSRDYVVG